MFLPPILSLALSITCVIAQAPTPSSVRGSCPPFDINQLLHNSEFFMLSSHVFSSSNQVINVMEARVICESFGLERRKFSSVTVIGIYACSGNCSPKPVLAYFSFTCQKGDNIYAFSDYTILTFSRLFFRTVAGSAIPGRCSLCLSSAVVGCVGTLKSLMRVCSIAFGATAENPCMRDGGISEVL